LEVSLKKILYQFAHFSKFEGFFLARNINSKYHANQDSMHIVKKIKNTLYNPAGNLMLGNHKATWDHLVILLRSYDKIRISQNDENPL
jgi:hypothetical protein